ncbi:NADPH:quinone reductase [Nonomuraea solani]|uniref:NADPH:quinone reductase n=1 Tax=Nonomuraea solani TaxID=1144553 RepID=A0A1H6DGV1_9ACTN|nr:NADP-dependent oxidoreductase [Nonomuraea solani]SEG84460.1 NADPH:quinone reductase [Nonomuraea solani]
MRAIAISAFGADPELVQVPEPVPLPGELLVRMRAAGYNPVDTKIASGAMKDRMSPRFPLIMGQDGAGVVVAVGAEVSRFRPGDEVYGRFTDPARGLGSYAEYGVVAEDGPVAYMPEGMLPEQAAAVPTATGTARDLVEAARLDAGHTVLIVGATGGVGQAAIQLAALRGAHVIATAGSVDEDLVRDLGAAETVDHTSDRMSGQAGGQGAEGRAGVLVADQVRRVRPEGLDAVLDLVDLAGSTGPMEELLRPGGVICSTVHALDPHALAARGLRGVNVINQVTGQMLAELAGLIEAGRLRVRVVDRVPLEGVPEALPGWVAGHAKGKAVIEIGA